MNFFDKSGYSGRADLATGSEHTHEDSREDRRFDMTTQWLSEATGGSPAENLVAGRLADEKLVGRGGFRLSSAAFIDGAELDPSFTATEEDAVAPPLEWTAPPPGTQELALVVQEVDAAGSAKVHWLVWGLAGQRGQLLEGETPPRTGKNAAGNSEWLLPNPPLGEERRYIFQLFALDLPLTLMPGAEIDALVDNIQGHVTACALLTARFEGHEVETLDVEDLDWND